MNETNKNKLYCLSVILEKSSYEQPLSYSHDIEKLQKSVYLGKNVSWRINHVHQPGSWVRETNVLKHPYYVINEVNFII